MVTGHGPRDASRLDVARSLGADLVVDVAVDDPVRALRDATGGALADVVVDVTAKAPAALAQAIAVARPGGTVVYSVCTINSTEAEQVVADARTEAERIVAEAAEKARTITAEVSPEEAQRLALAQQAGTLSLTLRNLVTTEKPALRSLSVSELSAATVKATGSHYTPTVTVNRAGQRSAVTVRGD